MRKLFFILALIPVVVFAQEAKKEDVWAPFRYFIGKWEGTGKGQSGISKLQAEAKFVLNNRYLEFSGKLVFEPQDKSKKGEVYEDIGFVSYDRMRKKFVLRQFNMEGFVNQYVLDSLSPDFKTLVFVLEGTENMPPGWRAKATHKILSQEEFHQTFVLVSPGKDFEVISEKEDTL
ncbi:MAG: hypothetical protein Q8O10_09035 [candidate division Zixibacteria bacterium]|nr:hypothetical protein [candidate division Zixibacteria bacterium]